MTSSPDMQAIVEQSIAQWRGKDGPFPGHLSVGYLALVELLDLHGKALAALSPSLLAREALEGYRAAVSWVAADSWDGCSDCIEWLKAASAADWDREPMSPDELATALARLRPHKPFSHPPTVAAQAPHGEDAVAAERERAARAMAEHAGWSWDGKDIRRSPANHIYWREIASVAFAAIRSAPPTPIEAEARVKVLTKALTWFASNSDGLQADILLAHRSRGNGATEWMREDDRHFRSDLFSALEAARAALASSTNGAA